MSFLPFAGPAPGSLADRLPAELRLLWLLDLPPLTRCSGAGRPVRGLMRTGSANYVGELRSLRLWLGSLIGLMIGCAVSFYACDDCDPTCSLVVVASWAVGNVAELNLPSLPPTLPLMLLYDEDSSTSSAMSASEPIWLTWWLRACSADKELSLLA